MCNSRQFIDKKKNTPNKYLLFLLVFLTVLPMTFTNLFPLQGGNGIPKAVKAVFDVVPTFALQRIVMCPFVCLQ